MISLSLFKPNIDLVSYADDNTPFAVGGSSELEVINEIKSVAESLKKAATRGVATPLDDCF